VHVHYFLVVVAVAAGVVEVVAGLVIAVAAAQGQDPGAVVVAGGHHGAGHQTSSLVADLVANQDHEIGQNPGIVQDLKNSLDLEKHQGIGQEKDQGRDHIVAVDQEAL